MAEAYRLVITQQTKAAHAIVTVDVSPTNYTIRPGDKVIIHYKERACQIGCKDMTPRCQQRLVPFAEFDLIGFPVDLTPELTFAERPAKP